MYSRIGADFSKPNVSCNWRQEMAIGAPKLQNGQNSISLAFFCPILTEMWNRTPQLRNWMCFYYLPNPSFSSITPPLLSPLKLVHFPLYAILPLTLSPLSFLYSCTLSSSRRKKGRKKRGTGKWDGQQKAAAWWFHLAAVWYWQFCVSRYTCSTLALKCGDTNWHCMGKVKHRYTTTNLCGFTYTMVSRLFLDSVN